ncbi:MAG: hypothetical protein WD076_04150, partial [Parvularculaceae bacterium]
MSYVLFRNAHRRRGVSPRRCQPGPAPLCGPREAFDWDGSTELRGQWVAVKIASGHMLGAQTGNHRRLMGAASFEIKRAGAVISPNEERHWLIRDATAQASGNIWSGWR